MFVMMFCMISTQEVFTAFFINVDVPPIWDIRLATHHFSSTESHYAPLAAVWCDSAFTLVTNSLQSLLQENLEQWLHPSSSDLVYYDLVHHENV
jgi:hypothetical protein